MLERYVFGETNLSTSQCPLSSLLFIVDFRNTLLKPWVLMGEASPIQGETGPIGRWSKYRGVCDEPQAKARPKRLFKENARIDRDNHAIGCIFTR